MKKWYLLLVIFSGASVAGMEQELNSQVVGESLAIDQSAVQADIIPETSVITTQANGQTIIDMKELLKQFDERLDQRELERKKERNKRCWGMYACLKNHPTATTIIQVAGSFASMAGVVLVYYH